MRKQGIAAMQSDSGVCVRAYLDPTAQPGKSTYFPADLGEKRETNRD
jgi:hypothetical protein